MNTEKATGNASALRKGFHFKIQKVYSSLKASVKHLIVSRQNTLSNCSCRIKLPVYEVDIKSVKSLQSQDGTHFQTKI